MLNESLNKEFMDEISYQLREASTLPAGSEEQIAVYDSVAKMYKLALEDEKMNRERREKEHDNQVQERVQKKRFILDAVNVGVTAVGVGATIWGLVRGFKFEETGTFTSQTQRNLFSKMFRFLK